MLLTRGGCLHYGDGLTVTESSGVSGFFKRGRRRWGGKKRRGGEGRKGWEGRGKHTQLRLKRNPQHF